MGAEQSQVNSAYQQGLSPEQLKAFKGAELQRKKSVGLKRRKSSYLGDVTAYPSRSYQASELTNIVSKLGGRLDGLNAHINQLGDADLAGFIREYTSIRDGLDKSTLASKIPQHLDLNRYRNILAYDHTRVKLTPSADTQNSDYINASHINGYNHPNKYIAAQGPIPQTFNAFWQMVWEYKIPTVVMVTNEVEGGKLKCHRYWPEGEGQEVETYGNYTVQIIAMEVFPLYVKRVFNVTQNSSRQTRQVIHYGYTAWPDHGVPNTTAELLQFRTTVRKAHDQDQTLLVHCSAGVGRTGTYIGLDRYLDSCSDLSTTQDVDVLKIVRDMRSSRNFMVQAQAQYVYLYEASRDGLTRLHEKAVRELGHAQKAQMSASQRSAAIDEMEGEVTAAEAALQKVRKHWTVSRAKGAKVVPDLTKEFIEDIQYTHDIHSTSRVGQDDRRTSLANSTTQWVQRRNVPMSPPEHGYADRVAPPLTSRLMALSDARTAWMTRYGELERTWQTEHDQEGVLYDVGTQMTPLESRVASLAAAEEAWALRSGSELTLNEERARLEVNDLPKRLESLQHTVLDAERRWRSKGHGHAETNQGPNEAERPINTSERLGSLTERLGALQKEQTSWERRENVPRFGENTFHEDVAKVAVEQESALAKKMRERREREEVEEAAAAEAAAKQKAIDDAREAEETAEAHRQKIKNKVNKFSKKVVDPTDPEVKRTMAQQMAAEEEALAAEVAALELEEQTLTKKQLKAAEAKGKGGKAREEIREAHEVKQGIFMPLSYHVPTPL
jgi:protein tyrosine phosphatase